MKVGCTSKSAADQARELLRPSSLTATPPTAPSTRDLPAGQSSPETNPALPELAEPPSRSRGRARRRPPRPRPSPDPSSPRSDLLVPGLPRLAPSTSSPAPPDHPLLQRRAPLVIARSRLHQGPPSSSSFPAAPQTPRARAVPSAASHALPSRTPAGRATRRRWSSAGVRRRQLPRLWPERAVPGLLVRPAPLRQVPRRRPGPGGLDPCLLPRPRSSARAPPRVDRSSASVDECRIARASPPLLRLRRVGRQIRPAGPPHRRWALAHCELPRAPPFSPPVGLACQFRPVQCFSCRTNLAIIQDYRFAEKPSLFIHINTSQPCIICKNIIYVKCLEFQLVS